MRIDPAAGFPGQVRIAGPDKDEGGPRWKSRVASIRVAGVGPAEAEAIARVIAKALTTEIAAEV